MYQSNRHIEPTRLRYTGHARKRMAQRAITREMAHLLVALGAEEEQKGGAIRLFIPERQRQHVRDGLRRLLKQFDSLQNSCIVLGNEGDVITTYHEKN